MRVLFLMPFSPVPAYSGGTLRMYHVLRQVSLRHEVTVVANGEPEQAEQLRREMPQLREVRFVRPNWQSRMRRLGQLYSTFTPHSHLQMAVASRALQAEVDRLAARERFDLVHTEFSHLGPLRLPAGARRVLDAHNVEYDVYRRMSESMGSAARRLFYGVEYRKIRRDELAVCRRHEVMMATSERDADIFRGEAPEVPCHVVPNGVDTAYFAPDDTPVEPDSLVFSGMMQYVPNYDGVGWFLDEVLPLVRARVPGVRLYVVGKSPPAHLRARASDAVVVTGTVPDVRPYVQRAAVSVVPLRMGGGTRLKIVEALAMKKPVVSTRVGAEGIDVVDGQSALLADGAGPFADAVVRALGDAALRRRLGEAGHALARERYDWSAIGEQVEALYRAAAAGRRAA